MSSTSIEAIKDRYRHSLPDKANELRALIKKLKRDPVAEQALVNAEAFLHRLAGSSGMYGYDAICECSQSSLGMLQQGQLAAAALAMQELTELLDRSA